MGLSITTVLEGAGLSAGGVRGGAGELVPEVCAAAGVIGGGLRDRGRQSGLGTSTSQPNLDRSGADVERSQIVPLHETNEVMKPLNVEWLGRTGGVLRHSFTPHLQTPSPLPWLASDRHADGR